MKHGVKVVEAAYESHEELGEVSLMITKHCVRWSMSLCPKQAKGVTGVQGTVRAEPLVLQHGEDKLTLRRQPVATLPEVALPVGAHHTDESNDYLKKAIPSSGMSSGRALAQRSTSSGVTTFFRWADM